MGERPLEIIGAIEMGCETVRISAKRTIGVIFLPFVLIVILIISVVAPVYFLFTTDSCEEFAKEIKCILVDHLSFLKNLLGIG